MLIAKNLSLVYMSKVEADTGRHCQQVKTFILSRLLQRILEYKVKFHLDYFKL